MLKKHISGLVTAGLLLSSCVYFNTFYNAETSFKKAMKLIEESPILEEDALPSQAKKLLGEAIENSKIVLKEYPESKYVDDAVFIIGKASFLRNETAIAEKNFRNLLRDYPESEFYTQSRIWLAYTHFRMGMSDSAKIQLLEIQQENLSDKENLYLLYNALAEIALEDANPQMVYSHYESAAEYAPSESKKTATFGKLVKIAETNLDKEKASHYLVSLGEVAPDKIRIDAKMQWIIYQRELGNYAEIIEEIETMLGLSEFAQEYMQLELELGKVYKDRGELDLAKEIFTLMGENYSKKNETAEAYYHLGFLALMEDFNLDLAKEYFEKSKTEKSQSRYGKESREFLNKISRFENLQTLYKESDSTSEEEPKQDELEETVPEEGINDRDIPPEFGDPEMDDRYSEFRNRMNPGFSPNFPDSEVPSPNQPAESPGVAPDSLLFVIGEMLLYDFNRLELSLEKFKSLAEEYPQSKFAPQALYVVSHYEPGKGWQEQLVNEYPTSPFAMINGDSLITDSTFTLENARDDAWLSAEESYEKSYLRFLQLYEEKKDTLSAYISGFISDYYLNDIERTVAHYQTYVDSFPGHYYTLDVQHRLDEIKENIEDVKAISIQGLEYQSAINYFQEFHDYDSVKVLLNNISNGENSRFKDAANHLKSVLRDQFELEEEIIKQTAVNEPDTSAADLVMPAPEVQSEILDSLYFRRAELFSHQLEIIDSALYFHRKVITEFETSRFRPQSYLRLSQLNPEGDWQRQLREAYPDTSFTPDSITYPEVYLAEIFSEDFTFTQEEKIKTCDEYLALFPQPVDTVSVMQDSLAMSADSLVIQVDSLSLPMDSLVNIKDSLNIPSDTLIMPDDSLNLPADSLSPNLENEGEPPVKDELTP
ncbi:MAG: hypothetical protein QF472_03655 [Candidatus Marinimicrobia bacterium]|nr:hypothetical protein [Candidatus Neomarinimicrobiota bacterium]